MNGSPFVGQRILILPNAPYFRGAHARIAYIGAHGVSVYLEDHDFDECIKFDNGEWEPAPRIKAAAEPTDGGAP